LALASPSVGCHIAATQYRERSVCAAAALPGRFLPELGRSQRAAIFLSGSLARAAAMDDKNRREGAHHRRGQR